MMPSCVAYHFCATSYEEVQEPMRITDAASRSTWYTRHVTVCGWWSLSFQLTDQSIPQGTVKIDFELSYINIESKFLPIGPKLPEGLVLTLLHHPWPELDGC